MHAACRHCTVNFSAASNMHLQFCHWQLCTECFYFHSAVKFEKFFLQNMYPPCLPSSSCKKQKNWYGWIHSNKTFFCVNTFFKKLYMYVIVKSRNTSKRSIWPQSTITLHHLIGTIWRKRVHCRIMDAFLRLDTYVYIWPHFLDWTKFLIMDSINVKPSLGSKV